jgi:CDP-glycerol glycerophosphotransferase (TagB/SpsB family)
MSGNKSYRRMVADCLKQEGGMSLAKKITRRTFNKLDEMLRAIFTLLPLKKNCIILESEGDFWDNARAFYEYLIDNRYNEKYRIIWIVHEPKLYLKNKNVKFVSRHSIGINLIADYYIARASCFLFTHPYWLKKWRKHQTVINLTHSSMMLKAGGKNISNCFDYILCASKAVKERKKKTYYIGDDQAVILGGPRIDLLFHSKNSIRKVIPNYNNEKVILSMSTFKQTKSWNDSISVDRFALNVIESELDLIHFNDFLEQNNTYLIVKIHHLQDISIIDLNRFNRIFYLIDHDLQTKDIQLYDLLGNADALITDYSSVYYDYLLLDRPIGFLIADIDDYSRGFCINNPLDEMPGEKIKNTKQLYDFVISINAGFDSYKKERRTLRDEVHLYKDDQNSARLISWLEKNNIIAEK